MSKIELNLKEVDHFIHKYKFINTQFYYGAHMSAADHSVERAINEINNMEGNCLQIFICNPRNGVVTEKSKQYYKTNGNRIINMLKEKNTKLFIHSAYTLNFAKNIIANSWTLTPWVMSYIQELEIAHDIGATGCVIHVGKRLDLPNDVATNNMYDSLSYIINIIKEQKLNSVIILETGAGQGTEMFLTENNSLDGFANFYNKFTNEQKKYIKICTDTCHVFAAGYDIRKPKMCVNYFLEFEAKIGLEHLILVHLNDSQKDWNSHVDRHENLGAGKIGIDGIGTFILLSYILNIPLILETPEKDPKEIIAIREIAMIRHVKNKAKLELKDIVQLKTIE